MHLSLELPVDDDLLFARQFAVEQLDGDVFAIKVEPPDELLFSAINMIRDGEG